MNRVKLEETESSALAAGRADAGASSGLHDDWDVIGSRTDDGGSGGRELFLLVGGGDGRPLWHGGIAVRRDGREDQEVRWPSLSESGGDGYGLLCEGKEGRIAAGHGCVVGHGGMSGVDGLGGSWDEWLELHFDLICGGVSFFASV